MKGALAIVLAIAIGGASVVSPAQAGEARKARIRTQNVEFLSDSQAPYSKVSPSTLKTIIKSQAQAVGHAVVHFPVEALHFYAVIGAFAFIDCTVKYNKSPDACVQFAASLADPMSYVSFLAFMTTSAAVSQTGALMAQSSMSKSALGRFATNGFLWGQLGMAAGGIVSSVSDELYRDPDVRLVASLMLRSKTPKDQKDWDEAWGRLETKWFGGESLQSLIPSSISLVTSAMVSAGVQGALNKTFLRVAANGKPALRTWVVRLKFGRNLVSNLAWGGGPLSKLASLALFLGIDHIISPTVGHEWEEMKSNRKMIESRDQLSFNVRSSINDPKKFDPKFMDEYMKNSMGWRVFVKSKYEASKSQWDATTSRFLSDVDTTYKFYRSFVTARPKADPGFSTYNMVLAAETGWLDWDQMKKFKSEELYYIARAHHYGFSRDFTLTYSPILIKDERSNSSLQRILNTLYYKSKRDLELIVAALNFGYEPSDVFASDRQTLQEIIQEAMDRRQTLKPTELAERPMILEQSAFNSFSQYATVRTLNGTLMRNMSEKLLISMACGPTEYESLYDPAFLGLERPEFLPPALFDSAPEVCGRIRHLGQLVGDDQVTLITWLSNHMWVRTPEEFDRWWERRTKKDIALALADFGRQHQKLIVDQLLPALSSKELSTPLNGAFLPGQPLPAGVYEALHQDLYLYLGFLRQMKPLIPKEGQAEVEKSIRLIQANFKDFASNGLLLSATVDQLEDEFLKEYSEPNTLAKAGEDDPRLAMLSRILGGLQKLITEGMGYDMSLAGTPLDKSH